jgi:leukotriene-A4 hydrolase
LSKLLLERLLGGLDVFLPYAKDYVTTFRGKSIRTDEWKAHLYAYFQKHSPEKAALLDKVDWEVCASANSSILDNLLLCF